MGKTRRTKHAKPATKRATASKLKAIKRSGRSPLRKTRGVKRAPRVDQHSEEPAPFDPHDPNLGPK